MMTFEQIMTIIVAAAPAISAILGIVVAVLKNKKITGEVINKFEEVRLEIFNTKEYSELKDQLKIVNKENAELKKKLNELLTKIDKIDRSKE